MTKRKRTHTSSPYRPRQIQGALRRISNSTPLFRWELDESGFCTDISSGALSAEDELKGMHASVWVGIIHPQDRERVIENASAAFSARLPFEIEYRLLRTNGTFRGVYTSGVPRFALTGQFKGFGGTTVDAADHHRSSQLLVESEAEYRLIADGGPDLIGEYYVGGKFSVLSLSYSTVLGYEPTELLGSHALDIIHPDDKPAVREEELLRVADGLHSRLIVLRMRHKDGHYVWMASRLRPLVESGATSVLRARVTARSIATATEYRSQQKLFREQFGALTGLASEWYWETNHCGEFTYVSEGAEPAIGVNRANLLGMTRLDLVMNPGGPGMTDYFSSVERREPFKDARYAMQWQENGPVRWVSIAGAPRFENDIFTGYFGTGRDITEEVELQGKVARLADENEAFIENAVDIMAMLDGRGRFLRVNQATRNMLGYEPSELLGRRLTEFLVPGEVESVESMLARLHDGERTVNDFENQWRRKDGAIANLSMSIRLSSSAKVMFATIRDVTSRHRLTEEVLRSRQEIVSVLESIGDAFFALDRDWRVTYLNRKTAQFIGRRREDVFGKILWEGVPEIVGTEVLEFYRAAMRSRQKTSIETYYVPAKAWVEVCAYPHDGGLAVFFHDVTHHHEATAELVTGKARLRKIIDLTPAGYALTDASGYIVDINSAMCELTGYAKNELIDRDIMELLPECPLNGALKERNGARFVQGKEASFRRKDGQLRHVLANVNIERDTEGHATSMTAFVTDITERKDSEVRMIQLATHDTLTGLPNRALINTRLQQVLDAGPLTPVAVMFIDLDNFKGINDSLGHVPGDSLLKSVGVRLRNVMSGSDIIGRLGGDEFAAVVHCPDGAATARGTSERILALLAAPFSVDGHEVFVSASIGISMFPDNGNTNEVLFQNADNAMYRAKATGRNCFRFFEPSMRVAAQARMAIEQSLRRALERKEFELHYQPRVNLKTLEITGMEALIRWNHPQLGRIPPAEFIPIAEERGLIESIGQWVLQEACIQARQWTERFGMLLNVSVNLSGRQLRCPDLVDQVAHALRTSGLSSHQLELEITETALIEDVQVSAKTLTSLKTLGVRLSIDDFGTGYSGLSYLRLFPLDILKLDRSFLDQEPAGVGSHKFVQAFINMAHALDLSVVAEGVEEEATAAFLRGARCDEAQGYLYSKPLAAAEFEDYLRRYLVLGHRH